MNALHKGLTLLCIDACLNLDKIDSQASIPNYAGLYALSSCPCCLSLLQMALRTGVGKTALPLLMHLVIWAGAPELLTEAGRLPSQIWNRWGLHTGTHH